MLCFQHEESTQLNDSHQHELRDLVITNICAAVHADDTLVGSDFVYFVTEQCGIRPSSRAPVLSGEFKIAFFPSPNMR